MPRRNSEGLFTWRSIDKLACGIDGRAGIAIRCAPRADGIEVLQREPERIHDDVARFA